MKQHLTDSIVKRLPAPARASRVTYDGTVKGFGVCVTASGTRSFVLNYFRKADGRERRMVIGQYPNWSTVTAREEAKRFKREVDGGGDPLGTAQDIRDAPTMPTSPNVSSPIICRASGRAHNESTASKSPPTFCPRSARRKSPPSLTPTLMAFIIGCAVGRRMRIARSRF